MPRHMLPNRSHVVAGFAVGFAVVLAVVLPCQADPAGAATGIAVEGTGAERPRIGLVLGGGGAKGAAHVGVLRVLEELNVPIDCIAGTSMGALIGATYAAGMRAADIESSVRGIDWAQTIGSLDLRGRMPIAEKLVAANYSNSLDLGLSREGLRGRGGLIATQNVEGLLTELVASAQFTSNFDELPIPFRAVATDMLSGRMVVLGEGDLAVAMRASMAIPGVFTPVRLEDWLLADGGITRNLPVDVARDLCADVVIAVWISTPQPEEDDIHSTIGMVNRALDVMVGANQQAQIESLSATDIGIEVPMADITATAFDRVGDAIDLGLAAARGQRERLARLSLPPEDYAAWAAGVHEEASETYELAAVEVKGLERVNPDYVESQLVHARPGATIGIRDIVADTQRIYALGDFERVEYRLGGTKDARVLELRPVEKAWGPNFISFDYGIASGSSGDLDAIVRADHERTWINRLGARWHNALQFGRQSLATTDFYQPLDVEQRYFLQPQLRFESNQEDIYLDEERVAVYRVDEWYGQLDAGVNLGTRAQLRAGLRHGWQSANIETGLPDLPELDREKDSSLQLRLIYDTRDDVLLPMHGSYFSARYAESVDWFGSDLDYALMEGVLSQAFNLNGNSLRLIVGGGQTLSGETPISQQIELGGIRTFPGLRPGELRGSDYWFAGSSYSWRLAELQPIFGQALYGGLRLQAGEMRGGLDDAASDVLYGLSGSLSGRTPIGPFLLSLGYVVDRQVRLQFMLGRPVPEGSLLDELQ